MYAFFLMSKIHPGSILHKNGRILPPYRCYRSYPLAAFRPFHFLPSAKYTGSAGELMRSGPSTAGTAWGLLEFREQSAGLEAAQFDDSGNRLVCEMAELLKLGISYAPVLV